MVEGTTNRSSLATIYLSPTPYSDLLIMNAALKALQLIVGLTLGLAAVGAGVGGAGYYFFVTQMNTRPPKPVFAEERPGYKPPVATAKSNPVTKKTPPIVKDPQAIVKLPAAAYDAKVIWKEGLSLKQEPDAGAQKQGSVAFNAQVAIIKTSTDKQWVLIRTQDNLQGWVKAGNIDKAAAELNRNELKANQQAPAPKRRVRRLRRRQVVDADEVN